MDECILITNGADDRLNIHRATRDQMLAHLKPLVTQNILKLADDFLATARTGEDIYVEMQDGIRAVLMATVDGLEAAERYETPPNF